MILNKKAISNLEMIISFTIFVMFVAFLFLYFPPIQKPDTSEALFSSLQKGVESNSKIDILEVPIIIPSTYGSTAGIPCFNFENPLQSGSQKNIIVKDQVGNTAAFNLIGANITIKNNEEKNNHIFYVRYSDKANFGSVNNAGETLSGCSSMSDYGFSAPRIFPVFLDSDIDALASQSPQDLREKLNFLASADFLVTITSTVSPYYSNHFSSSIIPQGVQVKAKDIPIEILVDGNVEKGILNLRIW